MHWTWTRTHAETRSPHFKVTSSPRKRPADLGFLKLTQDVANFPVMLTPDGVTILPELAGCVAFQSSVHTCIVYSVPMPAHMAGTHRPNMHMATVYPSLSPPPRSRPIKHWPVNMQVHMKHPAQQMTWQQSQHMVRSKCHLPIC
jgi:hypothetical protein